MYLVNKLKEFLIATFGGRQNSMETTRREAHFYEYTSFYRFTFGNS